MKRILTCALLLIANFLFAQTDPIENPKATLPAPKDSVSTTDTLVIPAKKDGIASSITYSCNDSITMDVVNRRVFLYGQAKVVYGDLTLTAGRIEIDYGKNAVKASPSGDSTVRDIPVFKQGADNYEARYIEYNIQTKKGLVRDIVTQQGDGYIQGDPVKRTEDAVYIKTARYTTCNLAHPHYYVSARKLKVIPEDKVVTGPFNVVISDIPTPLGLPFGFFPVTTKSKSGIIFPTIGEQRNRGFFLGQGGAYWAASDYLGVKLIGDYYTNNSYRAALSADYRNRYLYNGAMIFNYSRVKDGFDDEPFPSDFNLVWNHSTLKKTSGKISANVNLTSNSYNRLNSYNPTSYQSSTFNSTISYYKSFKRSPFNLGVTLRQDQNVQTKLMNLTAPEVNFSMNRIYPLKRKVSTGNRWYEKINMSYNMNTKYFINNKVPDGRGGDSIVKVDTETFGSIMARGQTGMKHSIPIATTFKVLKHFSVNPTLTYEDFWYLEKLNYSYNTLRNRVEVDDTIQGFNRAGSYNLSTNLTTRLYGVFLFKKSKVLKGIRHTLVPTVNYSYRPDFAQSTYLSDSYQQSNQVLDAKGNPTYYSRYSGFIYGGPGRGTVNSIGLNLQNNLEAKVRNRKDTTGTQNTKKINLIENIGISGNYNFTADSLKMSLIRLDARTRLFNVFDINFNSTFDPYIYKLDSMRNDVVFQRRVNTYAVDAGEGLAKLNFYSLSVGANFNPKARNTPTAPIPDASRLNPEELSYINRYPERYIDFKIPWSLALTYNLTYNKTGFQQSRITQSLSANGNLSLTEKWKITVTSGYDFVAQGLGYTTIGIIRDLHCWQMSMNIVPFGIRQSYFFTFTAKSSILQDLKLTKRSPTYFGQ